MNQSEQRETLPAGGNLLPFRDRGGSDEVSAWSAILGFAEHLVANAGRLWAEGNLEQRQMIQRAIFPEGLSFDGNEVGTGVTCLAFMHLPASDSVENGMASPAGFEPAVSALKGQRVGPATPWGRLEKGETGRS